MASALEISRHFCLEVILPLLRRRHGRLADRIALGAAGAGSDILGFDDDLSRDHHCSVRGTVLLADEDAAQVEAVRETLAIGCPAEYAGLPVQLDRASRAGLCVDSVGGYLHWFLNAERLPECDEDWFALCETDLLHVTSGEVFHDPAGAWSAARQRLRCYPDRVWRKRVADWCMYVTGRDAPYNLHRVARRHDQWAMQVYFGQAVRRVMELGFAIERQYAPYPKWQPRLFRRLGGCAPAVAGLLDHLVAAGDWQMRVHGLIEINHLYARRLHELGLTGRPRFTPFDPSLTDLTLYASATEIYAGLPEAWRYVSFNPTESWEKAARVVLFDSGDYFQSKYGDPARNEALAGQQPIDRRGPGAES